MNFLNKGGIHWSFWTISAVALIWNVMGSINFFVQMNPDMLATYPESERAVVESRPIWATVAFAIAVFGGALGCLLLLLRKSAAHYVFIASLFGVIITMTHSLGMINSTIDLIPVLTGTTMSLVLAAFLVWYSKWTNSRGWIS